MCRAPDLDVLRREWVGVRGEEQVRKKGLRGRRDEDFHLYSTIS